MMENRSQEQTPKRRREYSRVGAVLLSYDFYVGAPLGVGAAVSAAFSPAVRSALPGLLIGVAGVSAAVATLVLTSLAVLLGNITPAYRRMLSKVEGGVAGITRPFQWIVGLSAVAAAWSVIGAGIAPILKSSGWGAFGLAAPSFALLLWGIFGCVQLTGHMVYHWQQGERAEALEDRHERSTRRSA